ncbi:hypothetical protein COS31_05485 [Candidatus Roizmanbacteria bacterium CG02_land_8_20_14_3_00_36_15]|uniref:Methyltransferase domain-containing protein n=2 Tax=Candidatus Roizmaniibacteriota TaxID=1752723 RepID=A0A2M8KMB3_9BACT|nr:MAG: hypothetical protein COS51_01165 [Candidatus Roizmanbacteria bacterium CG03_land_8_20_14_0_80_36_21]PIV37262.1 MAG: hypothetical protein COS31_05485 [Candidatus Roizmanbacteria bacterium CG02_land_8_20_14_3_00_36_15]PIY70317.1 MAG: hypothetical protein COY89_01710 [Candidatus Roizmanbacteria bacterium CG_4_10_14_0_8_um_filter_36_36]PJA53116.1 MAG: hypothetical protein CO166_03080 [Candidatus Roizmanbacteria bacterium CG_4_9_14_3_um_filter_36_11]PJC81301.1 MAG: hypothetical protein CO007
MGNKFNNNIITKVPPDYYYQGIKKNVFQSKWHYGKLNAVLNLIKFNFKKVLDVGCASGWFTYQIAQRFPHCQIVGIDIYRKAIQYAKSINENNKKIHFRQANANKLPFKNNQFDLIICAEVIEHVNNPKKTLMEIKRVLAPRGFLLIEMDTGNWLFKIIWYLWTKFLKGKVWKKAHINLLNTKILEELLVSSGYKIKSKKIFNYSMGVIFLCSKILKTS